MNLVRALHRAARGYCEQRLRLWTSRYRELVDRGEATIQVDRGHAEGPGYTEAALSTFPRSRVLDTILREVEMVEPECLGSVADAKRVLSNLGEAARARFEQPFCQDIELQAAIEECALYSRYVEELSTGELSAQDLPA